MENKILSSDQKIYLSVYTKLCENPKGIIIITHGMCEHKERYYPFIDFLASNHFHCIIYDHRGHGHSIKEQNDLGYFYDHSGTAIVEDLHIIVSYAKQSFPTLPCFIFAHSMGTLVAQNYLQKYANAIDGLINCGQPAKNPLSKPGLLLAKIISTILGERHRSKLLHALSIGSYNKKFKGDLASRWICTDQNIVKKYMDDPLCHYVFTANGFINLMHLYVKCYDTKYCPSNINLPILLIAGEEDPVIMNLKSFDDEKRHLEKLGYTNITSKTYPSMRHEILNEPHNEQVYIDILNFYINIIKRNQ